MISIRRGDENDADILAQLNGSVQELHVTHMPQHFKPLETVAIAEWFGEFLQNSSARAWIAEVDGVAAGYVLATIHDRPETPFKFRRVYFEIDQISVAPVFRKKGLAKALVECVATEARSMGIKDIELNSWSFNTEAHAVFGALEFVPQRVYFTRTL